ncbi:31921_t:CDS:1, partial [Racocetra persica]
INIIKGRRQFHYLYQLQEVYHFNQQWLIVTNLFLHTKINALAVVIGILKLHFTEFIVIWTLHLIIIRKLQVTPVIETTEKPKDVDVNQYL